MNPLFTLSPDAGCLSVFQPGGPHARWLGLDVLHMDAGETWAGTLSDEEAVLVIMTGCATVTVKGATRCRWEGIGSREDIFRGPPTAIYVPRRNAIEIAARSRAEIAIPKAPCDVDLAPALITPSDVRLASPGAANWRRDVRLVLLPGSSLSQRLVIGETINPPGNWSGIPPHKHDEISPVENCLEEFYWYKIMPVDGYGVQLIYGDGDKQAQMVGNDQIMLFQRGYHPTIAAPGTTIGYLWALAGENKNYRIATDPHFTWVSHAESVIKEMQYS